MIFVTVGTQFPFDRLIRAVDDTVGGGLVRQEVFAQVGRGGYRPRNMKWVEELDKDAYSRYVKEATVIVGHAGTGTILVALEAGKPLLVMPRLSRLGEIVNDHQVVTARKFGEMGHILTAENELEIPAKLKELALFVPRARVAMAEPVAARIIAFLASLERRRGT
jgi:beta-1,4-N-acetylglucosaminyltransferase